MKDHLVAGEATATRNGDEPLHIRLGQVLERATAPNRSYVSADTIRACRRATTPKSTASSLDLVPNTDRMEVEMNAHHKIQATSARSS